MYTIVHLFLHTYQGMNIIHLVKMVFHVIPVHSASQFFSYIVIQSHIPLQNFPRFKEENLEKNKQIFERVTEMATKKGCTPSQLALAWVHHQGDDVCPIPGTTKRQNFEQNVEALSVKLTPEEMKELESYASADVVKGERHSSMGTTWLYSDTPPLSSWKAESAL